MDREDAMRREIAENIAGVAGVLDTRARWVLGLAEGDSKAEPGRTSEDIFHQLMDIASVVGQRDMGCP